MNKDTGKKAVKDMTTEELETYRHTPETELSVMVCHAAELGKYADLKDYLQYVSENNPKKLHDTDRAGMTALHCAVACSCLPAVILLLKYGADVDAKDMLGFTPLFLATGRYPNLEIAAQLLEEGHASVNATTKSGATALHGAALQGNTECVKLLLEHGADPRSEDADGTTPFDLAKGDRIKAALHEALIEKDAEKDTAGVVCIQCRKVPTEGELKRCSQCHVTLYCSRSCQVVHWKHGGHKANCIGYVIARPLMQKNPGDGTQMSFYRVMGSEDKPIKVFSRNMSDTPAKTDFLKHKRFVVKVQVPLSAGGPLNLMPTNGIDSEMMVYNADRTVEGFIYPSEKGYRPLSDRIRREGYLGIKGFFWAELMEGAAGQFKVFHGKSAPFQNW